MSDEDIFGLDKESYDPNIDYDLHENHVYSSECEVCKLSPEEHEIAKDIAKAMNENSCFDTRPRMTWITGQEKSNE